MNWSVKSFRLNMVASHEWIRQWATESGHIEPSACWGVTNAGAEKREREDAVCSECERDKRIEWREVDGGAARSSCLWIPRGWCTWGYRELTWWVFSSARKPGCSVSQKHVLHVFVGILDRTASYAKIFCYFMVCVCVCDRFLCRLTLCMCVWSVHEVCVCK
jgi:hypothetical protein